MPVTFRPAVGAPARLRVVAARAQGKRTMGANVAAGLVAATLVASPAFADSYPATSMLQHDVTMTSAIKSMDPPQEGDEDTGFSGRVAQGARGASNKAAEKKEKDEALKNAGEKASKIVGSEVEQIVQAGMEGSK